MTRRSANDAAGATPEGHNPLTPAVLHVLVALAEGPSHGYAIMQSVESSSGLEMGPGTVYGSIQRLLDAGLVAEVEVQSEPDGAGESDRSVRRGRRGRRYAITDAGRRSLRLEAVRLGRLADLTQEHRLAAEGERG